MSAIITPAEQSFSNNFWGLKDDGYYTLTAKMNSTKKTLEEIRSFYSTRASLHEEFGRKLLKHTKAGLAIEEFGTLNDFLSSANREAERTAEIHLNISQNIKTKLEVEFDAFMFEYKDRRKLTQSSAEKAHKSKQNSEAYLTKVKEKYEADCAKLVALQTQLGSLSTRDAERTKQKIERLEQEIKIQEQDYRNACDKVADTTLAWNRMWKLACDTYQLLEKKRLEFIQHSFTAYINLLSTATNEEQRSHKRLWKALDCYQPASDIQTFIGKAGTGPQIPEAEIFVDYFDDPQKTFQRHSTANFELPSELIMKADRSTEDDNSIPSTKPREGHVAQSSVVAELKSAPSEEVPMDQNSNEIQTSVDASFNAIKCELPADECSNGPKRMSSSERKMSLLRKANKPLPPIAPAPTPALSSSSSLREIQRQKLPPLIEEESSDTDIKETAQSLKDIENKDLSSASSEVNEEIEQPVVQSVISDDSSATPPVLIVPEISSPSSNDTSDEESSENIKKSNEVDEGNMAIDPRAKVVFAIGNNMFDLGHLDLENDPNAIPGTVKSNKIDKNKSRAQRSSSTTRRRPLSVDIEAACNFSYQSLLEELGVIEKNEVAEKKREKSNDVHEAATESYNDETIQKQQPSRENSQHSSKSQPCTAVSDATSSTNGTDSTVSARRHTHTNITQPSINMAQQPMPQTMNNMNNMHQQVAYTTTQPTIQQQQQPYTRPSSQVQQHAPGPQGALYHAQQPIYGTPTHNSTYAPQQAAASLYHQSTTGYVANGYSQQKSHSVPPNQLPIQLQQQMAPNIYQQQQSSVLFWGMTLTDWRSGKPEELQFTRGTWVGVLEVRPGNWYYAVKYDSRTNAFTNERGFVAQNMVQQVHTTTF